MSAGFDFAFMSGFCTAGARLGAPDTGLISYYEMVDQVGLIDHAIGYISSSLLFTAVPRYIGACAIQVLCLAHASQHDGSARICEIPSSRLSAVLPQGRYIHEATKQIPIIGDGDTGYGNAMNVKRTVQGYAAAGFAGIDCQQSVLSVIASL